MPGSSILTIWSPILTITRHTFFKLIAKKRSPRQENSDSSTEDMLPSKYQVHKPSVGEKLPNVAETQFLAQYIEKWNAELKNRKRAVTFNVCNRWEKCQKPKPNQKTTTKQAVTKTNSINCSASGWKEEKRSPKRREDYRRNKTLHTSENAGDWETKNVFAGGWEARVGRSTWGRKEWIWNVASHAWTGMNCFKIIFLIQ